MNGRDMVFLDITGRRVLRAYCMPFPWRYELISRLDLMVQPDG